MQLPFFYKENIDETSGVITLDEDSSKHIAQVLRMQNNEQIQLTDGKGNLYTCIITDNNRKKCSVTIQTKSAIANRQSAITIAISLLKTASRFEWFLEKATELGVSNIVPFICERTGKQSFKAERMKNILVSAMLQSRQCWLPSLCEPQQFNNKTIEQIKADKNFIAHCAETGNKQTLLNVNPLNGPTTVLIGPEGDFTSKEIELALENGFIPVSLGATRLRTETAGVAAATLLCLG